jgi:hypothetical protein
MPTATESSDGDVEVGSAEGGVLHGVILINAKLKNINTMRRRLLMVVLESDGVILVNPCT